MYLNQGAELDLDQMAPNVSLVPLEATKMSTVAPLVHPAETMPTLREQTAQMKHVVVSFHVLY